MRSVACIGHSHLLCAQGWQRHSWPWQTQLLAPGATPCCGGAVLVLGQGPCFPAMCDQQLTPRDTCLTSRENVTKGNNCTWPWHFGISFHCVRKSMLWPCTKCPQKWTELGQRHQEKVCRKTSQTSHTQHLAQPTPPQNLRQPRTARDTGGTPTTTTTMITTATDWL